MIPDWLQALRAGAAELELTLSAEEEQRFGQYLDMLLDWNTRINLTAILDPVDVARKHFVDALTLERVWIAHPDDRLIDIGTGGGVPGIPLAIRHPELPIVLNDSVRKKVDFLSAVAHDLALQHAHPLWARAESLGRDRQHREQYTVAVARAVAHFGALLEYALPLVRPGGVFIAMKGPGGLQEIVESDRALAALGNPAVTVTTIEVAGAGARTLIVVRKTRPTPAEYPRDTGAAKKKPLYSLTAPKDTP